MIPDGAYRTVDRSSEIELVINKSRFIGRCFPVESEPQAVKLLEDIRKRHYDASHNCFAYSIGGTGGVARYSDDGEPGGTAGLPIMEVLKARQITNVLCVVTRYFGGVLLGAGGLVRAYSKAASESVDAAHVVVMQPGLELTFTTDYSGYGTLERLLRERASGFECDFGAQVTIRALIEKQSADSLMAELIDKSNGCVKPAVTGEKYIKL